MIKPLGERIVVKLVINEPKTASGIVLPDSAKEKPQQGKVIAVGAGKVLESGQLAPMDVKVGDEVLFARYSGSEIKLDGEDLLIIRQSDILGILE